MDPADGAYPAQRETIGLVPAAGRATRIAPLPCSKELYPIGLQPGVADAGPRPRPVCQYLLEGLRQAGVQKTFIVIRDGKWDIPAFLGDGADLGLQLAYLMMRRPFGVPYTVDQAYPFVRDATVVFGFPDIILWPVDAVAHLLSRFDDRTSDVLLGLFPVAPGQRTDMVDLGADGRVRTLEVHPVRTRLRLTWNLAVWSPAFSAFMHDYLDEHSREQGWQSDAGPPPSWPELSMGAVLYTALQRGLRLAGLPLSAHAFIDIGTPSGLQRALQQYGGLCEEHHAVS